MIHDPEEIERIKRSAVQEPRSTRSVDDPKIAAALKQGDEALERAGVERQGGTGIARVPGGGIVISFGVAFGSVNHAVAVLNLARLGVPFKVRERGPIRAL